LHQYSKRKIPLDKNKNETSGLIGRDSLDTLVDLRSGGSVDTIDVTDTPIDAVADMRGGALI